MTKNEAKAKCFDLIVMGEQLKVEAQNKLVEIEKELKELQEAIAKMDDVVEPVKAE